MSRQSEKEKVSAIPRILSSKDTCFFYVVKTNMHTRRAGKRVLARIIGQYYLISSQNLIVFIQKYIRSNKNKTTDGKSP